MRKSTWTAITTAVLFSTALFTEIAETEAQPPFLPRGKQETAPRLPNNQIEGTIWQYSATRAGESKKLSGRLRIEGTGIFQLGQTISLPSKKSVLGALKKIREGEKQEVTLPQAPQKKRIGDVVKLSNGKTRLQFQDYEPLPGYAIIWPKKDQKNVWIGYFQEKEGKKNGPKWTIELRASED